MPKMQFDKTISFGNLISWGIMLVSLGIGYQKLKSSTEVNQAAVIEARAAVAEVKENTKAVDAVRASDIKVIQSDVSQLKTDVAVTSSKVDGIKTDVNNLTIKIDQVLRQTR